MWEKLEMNGKATLGFKRAHSPKGLNLGLEQIHLSRLKTIRI